MPVSTSVVGNRHPFVNCVEQLCSRSSTNLIATAAATTNGSFSVNGVHISSTSSIPIPISIVDKSGVISVNAKGSSSCVTVVPAPALISSGSADRCRSRDGEDDPTEPPRKKNNSVGIKDGGNGIVVGNKNSSGRNGKNSIDINSNNLVTTSTGNNVTITPKLELKFPSSIQEEADCDPDNCDCGECETDSLFGDLDHDYLQDYDNNFVSSSDNQAEGSGNTDTEEDWNNNDSNSTCSNNKINDDDDEEDDEASERRKLIPCIHCQGGKDHSKVENLIWPVRLDIDLIETLFQLCPDFFEDFDEVEMDPMELTNASPLSIDPNHSQLKLNQQTLLSSSSSSQESESGTPSSQGLDPQPSPPNVQVDDSPLQPSMDRNKESLKVKLLLRRPMNQLVEQGILPPPKTPAAFAGQRVRLERARMGDLLKVKIQQRPARQELVRQHILEDTNARVAPSLAEKQRMLKRARLADSLNDHLIHRPGPLELVQKNILHAPDAQMEQAIKEGVVEFKPTSEGHTPGHPPVPNVYLCGDDESSSDLSSPAGTPDHSVSQNSADSSSSSGGLKKLDEDGGQPSVALLVPSSPSLGSTVSTLSPISVVAVTPPPPPPPPPPPLPPPSVPPILGRLQIHLQNIQAAACSGNGSALPPGTIPVTSAQLSQLVAGTGGNTVFSRTSSGNGHSTFNQVQHQQHSKSRSSKKSGKTKSQPKARTIKFHEYKGPPNAQKGCGQQSQQSEQTSYELLLQQQQLFLQWQLEWQHKYPQIILPAVSKLSPSSDATVTKITSNTIPVTLQTNGTSRTGPLLAPAGSSSSSITPTLGSSIPVSTTINTLQSVKPQPIAPAPIPLSTASTTSATTTITIPVQNPIPMQVTGTEIKQAQTSQFDNSNNNNNHQVSGQSISGKLRLNDWKVSDLKAELKRRNLPVSGSKPQLVERLRQAESNVQDEAVSTTTPPPKSENGNSDGSLCKMNSSSSILKTEMDESSSSSDPMDISESSDVGTNSSNNNNNNNNNIVTGIGIKQVINKKLGIANAPQLINTSQVGDKIKLSLVVGNNNSQVTSNNNNNERYVANNKTKIDEKVIREQQKQIEQLQQALKNSQQQLQQMKSTQQGGGQKHRLALQQHLQQKIQQQALQAQLQKLIQLHSMQQQQQQQQKVVQITQMASSPVPTTPTQQQEQGPAAPVISNTQQSVSTDTSQVSTISMVASGGGLQLQQSQQQQMPKIPFTIVKLATIPTTTVATATISTSTPELQQHQPNDTQIILAHAPMVVATAKTSEIDSEQSSKWISPTNIGDSDSMDHSWLLKINEVSTTDANNEISKDMPDFLVTYDSSTTSTLQKQPPENSEKQSDAKKNSKDCFKSQMVDDVLEILIRNFKEDEMNRCACGRYQKCSQKGRICDALQNERKLSSNQAKGENSESVAGALFHSELSNRPDASITLSKQSPVHVTNNFQELPLSAVQEPTPTKTPSVPYPNSTNTTCEDISTPSTQSTSNSNNLGIVPPPPPLPPATFAVTLPTSMTFSRIANAIPATVTQHSSQFVPIVSTPGLDLLQMQCPGTPTILDILQESSSASSSSLSPMIKITIPKQRSHYYFGQDKEPLSKEAEDILKISKDLSNFGREHAESEQLAAAAAATQNQLSNMLNSTAEKFQSRSTMIEDVHVGDEDDENNSLSLLLCEVEKDLHLVDDMDVVLDDTSSPSPHINMSSNSRNNNSSSNENKSSVNSSSSMNAPVPMSIDTHGQNQESRKNNDDDFLDELGLFHSDLDVPMPMEMDYSDWLENLLPNNCSNSTSSATNLSQQQQQQQSTETQNHDSQNFNNSQGILMNNSEGIGVNFINNNGDSCSTFFGVSSMDFNNVSNNSNHNQSIIQRDPLLSSTRSVDIFTAANADVVNNSVIGGFGIDQNLAADMKGHSGAPMSPMNDSLLWDFAM